MRLPMASKDLREFRRLLGEFRADTEQINGTSVFDSAIDAMDGVAAVLLEDRIDDPQPDHRVDGHLHCRCCADMDVTLADLRDQATRAVRALNSLPSEYTVGPGNEMHVLGLVYNDIGTIADELAEATKK